MSSVTMNIPITFSVVCHLVLFCLIMSSVILTRCQYDFVELHDGGTINSPIIGTFCGTSTPSTQTSTGHVMFIRFRSDDSVPRSGFNATVGFGNRSILSCNILIS